jgi:subtilase family serine protease
MQTSDNIYIIAEVFNQTSLFRITIYTVFVSYFLERRNHLEDLDADRNIMKRIL